MSTNERPWHHLPPPPRERSDQFHQFITHQLTSPNPALHTHSVPEECSIRDVFTATFPPIVEKLAARAHGVCGVQNTDATLFMKPPQPLRPGAVWTLGLLACLALAALAATVLDVVRRS